MFMGVPPTDESRLIVGRAEGAHASRAPDANELRTADQMRRAGLNYRPPLMSPTMWVILGLGVLGFVLILLLG